MGLFVRLKAAGRSLDNMEDLLVEQLNEIHDTEDQLLGALGRMKEAANAQVLKDAFDAHIQQTQRQKERLEQVFRELNREPSRTTCAGMKSISEEVDTIISMDGDPLVKDAALISAAQRVEHYEMAIYGSARTFARELGIERVANLLEMTMDEEGATDRKLSQVAISDPRASQD